MKTLTVGKITRGGVELQAATGLDSWHGINWPECWRQVRSLQRRIVKAVQVSNWRKVKRLSYLLVNSFAARALAVKRVTENSGKRTPGIDRQIWETPQAKIQAVKTLRNWKGYQPKPLKRLYIPKKNGKKRPLSIPVMEDRARQALHMQALVPVAETTADENSYGFRAKRGCADAIDQCFKILRQKNSATWILEGDIRANKINFDRYADDFIVTASNKEVLIEVIIPKIKAFLEQRGVSLSPEKTKITHINQGFDFLGQTLRKHKTHQSNGKLQITPSKESIKKIKAKVSEICKTSGGLTQEQLIGRLNPVLRGWANYHRHSICATSFSQLDSHVWSRVYRWARRRHPNKTGRWIADRYFIHTQKQRWIFQDKQSGKQLIRIAGAIKHQRHIKVKAQANPFDKDWEDYFTQRSKQLVKKSTHGQRAKVLKRTNGTCIICKQVIQIEDELDLHHVNGNHEDNRVNNLILLHPNCHRQVHHSEFNVVQPRLSHAEGRL